MATRLRCPLHGAITRCQKNKRRKLNMKAVGLGIELAKEGFDGIEYVTEESED